MDPPSRLVFQTRSRSGAVLQAERTNDRAPASRPMGAAKQGLEAIGLAALRLGRAKRGTVDTERVAVVSEAIEQRADHLFLA